MLLELWSGYSTRPNLSSPSHIAWMKGVYYLSIRSIRSSIPWLGTTALLPCRASLPLFLKAVSPWHSGTAKSGLEDYAGTATHGRGRTAMRLDIDMWSKTNQIRSRLWDPKLRIGLRPVWKLGFCVNLEEKKHPIDYLWVLKDKQLVLASSLINIQCQTASIERPQTTTWYGKLRAASCRW